MPMPGFGFLASRSVEEATVASGSRANDRPGPAVLVAKAQGGSIEPAPWASRWLRSKVKDRAHFKVDLVEGGNLKLSGWLSCLLDIRCRWGDK